MVDVITTLLPLRVILADVIAMMSWCYVTTNVDVCLADVINVIDVIDEHFLIHFQSV